MKRIILGISVLLILVQNGFAEEYTDQMFDKQIANSTGHMQQSVKCEKVETNHVKTGDINECIKAVKMLQKLPNSNPDKAEFLKLAAFYTGQMAYYQADKLKAYKYWMLAAKNGYKNAQRNLSIMCKKDPWACK